MPTLHPGARVLVEVSTNRWAFGTVLKTASCDAEIAIDGESVRHWWTYDKVRQVAESPRTTLDHDFFAKKAA